jgi:hypothetical protein
MRGKVYVAHSACAELLINPDLPSRVRPIIAIEGPAAIITKRLAFLFLRMTIVARELLIKAGVGVCKGVYRS